MKIRKGTTANYALVKIVAAAIVALVCLGAIVYGLEGIKQNALQNVFS